MLRQTNGRENRQSIAHYSASLRQLNEALASPDPEVSTSVDVVRAVLAFICHDVSLFLFLEDCHIFWSCFLMFFQVYPL